MLKSLQQKMLGKKKYQRFFDKLYHFSKYGRNIGSPIDINTSGEIQLIKHLRNRFENKTEIIFFDIGANNGLYTDNVMKFLSGNAVIKCFLFEPQKELYKNLLNRFENNKNVVIINKGCGSKTEDIKLYTFSNIDTLSSAYDTYGWGLKSDGYEIMEIIRIDSYAEEKGINNIDFIKIDVEGYEMEVLRGLGNYVTDKKISVIQFEMGGFNIASRTFFRDYWDLLSPNYTIHRVLKDGLWPIVGYSTDLEIFDTTNYVAFVKV
jgi:FkbM family methyltransferase